MRMRRCPQWLGPLGTYKLCTGTACFSAHSVRCAQAAILPGLDRGVELVPGDVFQYATLPRALGDANALIIATGSRAAFDPFGPFNVDYQACPWALSAFVANRNLGGTASAQYQRAA